VTYDHPIEPQTADVPDWFREALANRPLSRRVTVMDCPIHYLRWGPEASDKPGILFLHGGGAHARWWSYIAPFFAEDRPVAAIDFSGMGDSRAREAYGGEFHVPEIAAVLADGGLGKRPLLVGHSFGGYMAMCHAHRYRDAVSGVVVVDSPLRPEDAEGDKSERAYVKPKSVFPDFETIVGKFKVMPKQPNENPFLLDFIARNSVREENGGWCWKFDVAARGAAHFDEPLAEYLRNLSCRKALIYGAESAMVTPDAAAYMKTLFGPTDPVVCMPGAHHHLMLEQPLGLVAVLRSIFSGWGL
jgi:pimeloyl-ACP methyl ester carboxylesterase